MTKCPQCGKLAFGEMQSFCKFCLYTFNTGGDRWFNLDDEEISVKELE
jgi:hypothetical protein